MGDYQTVVSAPWYPYRDKIKRVVVENGITYISDGAFPGYTKIESVYISGSVKSMYQGVFAGCTSLKELILEEGVERTGDAAFASCTSLTSVTLPDTLVQIDQGMFNKCTNLSNIFIPTSVKAIGPGAFNNCVSLRDVYYAGTKEQWKQVLISNMSNYNKYLLDATIHFNSTESTPRFTDVPQNAFYATPVSWAVENGITSGTSPTTFSPNQSCTRAQAVTFLWNAAGKPEPTSYSNPFTDVFPSDWYYKAVLWAVGNNITSGVGGNSFALDQTCSRGQIVTFLWRANGQPFAGGSSDFVDVSKGAYYENSVNWAVGNGITSGIGNGRFDPDGICTRGQIVTFLYRTADVPPADPLDSCLEAYANYLQGVQGYERFGLAYIDNDAIPELIICIGGAYAMHDVFSFFNGEVIGNIASGKGQIQIVPYGGIIFGSTFSGPNESGSVKIYSNGSTETLFSYNLSADWAPNGGIMNEVYCVNGAKVSKDYYDKQKSDWENKYPYKSITIPGSDSFKNTSQNLADLRTNPARFVLN